MDFDLVPLECHCMRLLVSLRIAVVYSLGLRALMGPLNLSFGPLVGLGAVRPKWTWLVACGEIGGRLIGLLPWDPTRARSSKVQPLRHMPHGRLISFLDQPRMSL